MGFSVVSRPDQGSLAPAAETRAPRFSVVKRPDAAPMAGAEPAAPVQQPDQQSPQHPVMQQEAAPTGLSADLVVPQLKSGVETLKQSGLGTGLQLSERSLRVMDRIDAGEQVGDQDDPLGYGQMDQAQRAAARQQTEREFGEGVARIIQSRQTQAELPRNPNASAIVEAGNAGNWGQAWQIFKSDPLGITQQFAVESLPVSAPAMAAGLATAGFGRIPAALSAFGGSYATEYGPRIVESVSEQLQQRGIDINDEAAVSQAIQADPAIMAEARRSAGLGAAGPAAFDALTMGGASGFRRGAGAMANAKAVGKNAALEIAGEPAGEAAGQVLADGEVSKPGELIAEALGAGPQVVTTTAAGTVMEAREQAQQAQQQPSQPQPPAGLPEVQLPTVPAGYPHLEQPQQPAAPRFSVVSRPEPAADTSGRIEPTFAPAPMPEGAVPAEAVIGPDPEMPIQPDNNPVVTPPSPPAIPPSPPPPGRDQLLAEMRDVRSTDELQDAARKERGTGERDAPVKLETAADVNRGAEVTASPTPAQAEAGNYRKRHVKWQGLDVAIETEAGQTRSGIGADGVPWSVEQPAPYGYIKRTEGKDGDQVDVYFGPSPDGDRVVVIDQIDPKTGKFDEHKVMVGFADEASAVETYHRAFSDGSGPARMGATKAMTVQEFKTWLRDGNTKKPLAFKQAAAAAGSPLGGVAGGPPAGVGVEPQPARRILGRKPPAMFKNKPMNIIQFIATKGGVRDEGGELKAMDAGKWFYPGLGKFVRPKGQTLDYAREAAVEAGFLPEDADINALLDAIRETLAGNAKYSAFDEDRVLEMRQADERRAADERMTEEVAAARKLVAELRLNATDEEIREAAVLSLQGDMDLEGAIVDVLERAAIMAERDYSATAQEAGDAEYTETPFDEPRTAEAPRAVEEPAAPQRVAEEPQAGAAQGSAPAREQRDEAGRDQGEQKGPVAEELTGADTADDATAKATEQAHLKVWNSAPFKAWLRKLGDNAPHRESGVAADMVHGWRDAKDGKQPAVRELDTTSMQPTGFNPISPYLMGYWGGRFGEAKEIRALKVGNTIGSEEALAILNDDEASESVPLPRFTEAEAKEFALQMVREGRKTAGNTFDANGETVYYSVDQGRFVDYTTDQRPAPFKEIKEGQIGVWTNRGGHVFKVADLRGKADKKPRRDSSVEEVAKKNDDGTLKSKIETATVYTSALTRAITDIKQPKAPPAQWQSIIRNLTAKGVKQEEIDWSGVIEWLQQQTGTVTKEQVRDYLEQNDLQLTDVVMEQAGPKGWNTSGSTRYEQYTLPGGQNYRELLITMPAKTGPEGNAVAAFARSMREKYGERWISEASSTEKRTYDELIEKQEKARTQPEADNFKSGHFDVSNILAHVRFNERTDADGRRVLLIEEIQSDWHQKGRKQGYRSDDDKLKSAADEASKALSRTRTDDPNYAAAEQRFRDAQTAWMKAPARVPDAPLKTTWHELGFRRAVRWAAENGFDRVAWTTGEQQADRFDLSKHIDTVRYVKTKDGKYITVNAYKDGKHIYGKTLIEIDEVAEHFGKDIAEKIKKDEGKTNFSTGDTELTGLDLKFGGEGMRGFYDKILPTYASKFGKKFGAKVGQTTINATEQPPPGVGFTRERPMTVHSMDITPQMRESVMGGVTMFQRPGPTRRDFVAGAGAAAVATVAPRAVRAQSALTNKDIVAAVRGGDLNKALSWIGENGSTEENKTLARLLSRRNVGSFAIKVLPEDDAKLQQMVKKKEITQRVAETVDGSKGFVILSELDKPTLYLVEKSGMSEETLLHEAIHAFVLARYRSFSTYLPSNIKKVGTEPGAATLPIQEFNKLWRGISDALEAKYKGKRTNNLVVAVIESPDEMLAYALTNKDIQDELRALVWDDGAKKWTEAKAESTEPTAWDRFVKWLADLLGFKGKAQISALDKVLSAANTVFDASAGDKPDFRFARGLQKMVDSPKAQRSEEKRPVDRTAEGDQTVIPGAERITDRQLAERRMEGGKKGKAGQKGAEELPLFDVVGRSQGALFSREPETVEERQQAVSKLLELRQPVDRALRVPFQIFGGVDQRGAWKPGQKLYDKAANVISNAEFAPNGKFAFMNPVMRTARAGLIDRYGLAAEYVDRERQRGLDERRVMLQGAEMVKNLKDHSVGPEEARVLQAILTGEAVVDADMERLAQPIREAVDALGREAVELGLVSAESYERNRGTYLHRVYAKDETNQNALGRWISKFGTTKRNKLIGDQFKGRGMFVELDVARLMRDNPEFHDASTGKPENGQRFKLLEQIDTTPALIEEGGSQRVTDRAGQGLPKVTERVYWPADRAVPDKYQGERWRNNGTWQVRGVRGEKITLWRDFTKAEREKMGEILDARYTIAKTFMLMAHDLANGRFYRDIAQNGEWARTDQPNAKWMDAAEYGLRHWGDPEIEWIKVPGTTIADTGGKPKWGALADKWVRAEIWRDLNEIDQLGRPSLWNKLLTQWKLNKTARSPVVHMNNVMSNMVFMDMADVPIADLIKGIRSYVTEDAEYKEAFDNGAFGADMVANELRKEILEPVLKEIERQNFNGRSSVEARIGVFGKIAEAIWTKVKAADDKMINAYRMEDEIFRMAMYHRRRQQGFSPKVAADEARQQFLDYDIRAPWVNKARRTILPFIAYTYRAVPVIARSIAAHPWKLAKYFMIMYALDSLAYMMAPGDEEEERRSLRDQEQGYTWIGVPRMLRLPFYDENGHPMFLDIRRWIPAGDVFDMAGSDFIPPWMQFGGPLQIAAELFFNRVAFTGQEIINKLTDDWWDKLGKYSDHLYKAAMPSAPWVPNSWYWQKIENAAKGATDFGGNQYSLPQAALSSVGIKARGQDVETSFEIKALEFNRIERELNTQMRALQRKLDRGLITEKAFDQNYEDLLNKMDKLDKKRAEVLDGIKE